VKWLTLRARAEMLAGDHEPAIATLHRVLERKLGDPDVLADLGMAYALRAEAQNRKVDYSAALEYLGRSLKAKPNSLEALFNLAFVQERLYSYDEACVSGGAISIWIRPAPGGRTPSAIWPISSKKKVRQTALDKISHDPELLLRRIDEGEDVEPENYQNLAIAEWLPQRGRSAMHDPRGGGGRWSR